MTEKKTKINISYILLLASMGFMSQFGSDIFVPSLPAISLYFNIDNSLTQYTVALYVLGLSIFQFIFGPLSDVYGRKPMLLIGVIIFCFGSLLCVAAVDIKMLLAGRLIQGFGLASLASFRSIMRDKFHGIALAKVASILTIVYAITPTLAPIIGGYLQALSGWRASFIVLIVMGVITLFIYVKFFEETLAKDKRQPLSLMHILKGYLSCICHRKFLLSALSSSMCVAIIMGFVAMGAFIFQHQLGLTSIQYGWISVVSAISMPIGAFLTNRLIKRLGQVRLIFLGGIIISTAALIMLLIGLTGIMNLWVILLPMSFIFAGMGFIFPNAFSVAFADFGHIAGIAGAMYGGVQLLGGAIATGLAAHLPLESQVPMAGYILGCGLIILLATTTSKLLGAK